MPTAAPLTFLPPRLDARVLASARLLLPLWLRRGGLRAVQVQGIERLQLAMAQFQGGQSRLLLAFRHPNLDDPAVMAHLLWVDLARAGRPDGRRFRPRPHAQFLYDRGIPLWAGSSIGWLLSHLGGCSIQRSKLDLPALRTARALLLDGPHPFAVAPEGAPNGHNEVISPVEPGVAQLAVGTADDLNRAGRPEAPQVLPIGLQYRFTTPVWSAIEALLRQLEADVGLDVGLPAGGDEARAGLQAPPSLDPQHLYQRLFRLAEVILTRMEDFYRDAYHQPLPKPERPDPESPVPESPIQESPLSESRANALLAERLGRLMQAALRVVEQALAVEPHGTVSERCRRLEQAGWERLYPANRSSTALDQGLAERLAEETELRLWHMRMVESFVAVSGSYVKQCPSQERFADTLLILWDTLCRIKGGNPEQRPRLGPRMALLCIGEPLAVTPRLAAYRADRRSAVAELTADLQERLEGLIVPSFNPPPAVPRRHRANRR
ncbi:MAG: 1-acyl-sn-glycerol-3-phosphate acyltransferase [Cyanobacteriota bacterium]